MAVPRPEKQMPFVGQSLCHVFTNVLSNKIEVEIEIAMKLKLKLDNELQSEIEVATRSDFREK